MPVEKIGLSHGSGSGLAELLKEVVIPILAHGTGGPLEDAAVIETDRSRLAFTTDSFVVQPLEFPGGDIGKLAACGTVNDLAMVGAVPEHLSVALILEEGLDVGLLKRVLQSLSSVCEEAHVRVVCGDTKVIERGRGDGIYITTSGIGRVPQGRRISAGNARVGDSVIVSGPIGLHGVTIMAQRKGLGFASDAVSDCAPLCGLVESLLAAVPETGVLRDATRGGCAAVLNEIADSSGVTVRLKQADVPVPAVVTGACSYLGLDPLQVANEGRFVAIVPSDRAAPALDALRSHPLGDGAAAIGSVEERQRFGVLLDTLVGGTRPLEVPSGEILPRIC